MVLIYFCSPLFQNKLKLNPDLCLQLEEVDISSFVYVRLLEME